jgi:hypothetical protein
MCPQFTAQLSIVERIKEPSMEKCYNHVLHLDVRHDAIFGKLQKLTTEHKFLSNLLHNNKRVSSNVVGLQHI